LLAERARNIRFECLQALTEGGEFVVHAAACRHARKIATKNTPAEGHFFSSEINRTFLGVCFRSCASGGAVSLPRPPLC
jgi:hypothetical protein